MPAPLTNEQGINTLRYIAYSPPPEHGGFHPQTVTTARWALKRIAELERAVANGTEALRIAQGFRDGHPAMCCGACHDTLEAIRSEVERLRAEARWVPCSERMPEEHSLVLVTVTGLGHDESPRLSGVAWVSAGKWIGGGSGRPIVHQTVVAWRPLPAPYQEDSNVAS